MAKFRIITFDGGGIKGVISVTLLKRINAILPGTINKTDLFAGTSTGSFIALGLASGLTPEQLADLYSVKICRYIFNPRHVSLLRPKYNNSRLKKILKMVFKPELKLKDLKHNVLIPAFGVKDSASSCWNPVFFHNLPGSESAEEDVISVALSSSAAPTFFPSHKNHIDGGVFANNPSTAAIAAATDPKAGGRKIEDICLLSVGTGGCSYRINNDTSWWGGLHWLLYPPPAPILNAMLDGVCKSNAIFSHQLLGDRYYRLDPLLKNHIMLDDYQAIPELNELAENYDLEPALAWLKNNW